MSAAVTPIFFMPSWLAQEQLHYQHILELSAIRRIQQSNYNQMNG
jgi:hypothetical protein